VTARSALLVLIVASVGCAPADFSVDPVRDEDSLQRPTAADSNVAASPPTSRRSVSAGRTPLVVLGSALPDLGVPMGRRGGGWPWVLVVASLRCPCFRDAAPRLAELETRFRARSVPFVFLYADARDQQEEIPQFHAQCGFQGAAIIDGSRTAARRLGEPRACEVLAVDADGVLRYRGAIDMGRPGEPVRAVLVEALDAMIAGTTVLTPSTSVRGCPLPR